MRGEYDDVVKEFPRWDLKESVIDILDWVCLTKPDTTYGEFSESRVG